MRAESSDPMPAMRLVEQQKARPCRERHGDLERPLLAVRQSSPRVPPPRPSSPTSARMARAGSRSRGSRARRPPEAEAVPGVRLDGERDVVERGELGEDARDLKRAGEAPPRARVRRQRG